MTYVFRFTLDGDAGSHQIQEPIGWKDIELSLDRDLTYHSLVENITTTLTFYSGANGEDGGYDYLRDALETFGPDLKASLEIEISQDDGATFENLFTGLLKVDDHRHIEFYKKIEVPIIRDDLWSRFIARKGQDVDIKSTEDLYGNTVTPATTHTLTLTSQKVRQKYYAESTEPEILVPANGYVIFDLDKVTFDEIDTKFNYPRIYSVDRPFELFSVIFGGDYNIELLITIAGAGAMQIQDTELYIQINDDTPIAATKTQQGIDGFTGSTKFEYDDSHALNKNDLIRIYFQNTGGSNDFFIIATHGSDTTFLEILADTVYEDTHVEALYPYDVLKAILQRITGQDSVLKSDFFGGTDTIDAYDEDGCGTNFKLFRGIQARGYSYTDKPWAPSFDDILKGLDGVFNIGLGYETDDSSPDGNVLRIEPKEYFYDDTGLMESLSDVSNIEMSFDLDLLFNKIDIGYNKWSAEAESGIDDPQTKQQYGTPLRTSGVPKEIISPFVAASLALEQTRRVAALKRGQDWMMDEDVFIVQTDPDDPNTPRLLTAPYAVTNVLNWETRYNLQLTPHDNLLRWKNILSIGLYLHPTGEFTYRSGEGNQAMIFDGTGATQPDCDLTDYLAQNTNEVIGSDFLFQPVLFHFGHQMTYAQYKNIRDNRRSAIQVTYVGNDRHSYQATLFIKKLAFKINEGSVTVDAWVKTVADLGEVTGDSVFSQEFSEEFA